MAGSNDADGTIKDFLAKYKTTGILLHRPYPPLGLPPVRRRLGGLPNLPQEIAWPWGRAQPDRDQVPLHFLAQIDCAELPQIDARMPCEGMLFFFAREDEETIWGQPDWWKEPDCYTPQDDCRVIYVRHIEKDQPARHPPDELPPIGDRRAGYDRALPDEPGPSIHSAWPLLAVEFDTWPDSSAFDPPLGYGYDEQVDEARIASFAAATGRANRGPARADWQQDIFPSKPFKGPDLIPVGSMIHELAYEIIAEVLRRSSTDTSPDAAAIVFEARKWLAFAKEVDADEIVPAAKMAEFEAWLDIVSQPNHFDVDPPQRTDRQAYQEWFQARPIISEIRCEMPNIFSRAIRHVIRTLASSPAGAALVPTDVYDAVETNFLPFDEYRLVQTHQMLGYPPVTQDALPIGSDVLCLLRLGTDDGVGMMFGDVGEAVFWIAPEDLTRGRFEKVWLTLQGH